MEHSGVKSILLVEHVPEQVSPDAKTLTAAGYQVFSAQTLSESTSLLEQHPDIGWALIDLQSLPDCSGIETARSIQERHDLPIVFIGACPEPDTLEQAGDLRFYGFVQPGGDRGILLATLVAARKNHLNLIARAAEAKQVQENKERLQAVLDSISASVFVHPLLRGGPATFMDVNSWACQRYGYNREEFLALNAFDLSARPISEQEESEYRQQLLDSRELALTATHVTKSGEEFPVEIRSTLIQMQGQPMLLSVVTDITERQEQLEALRESESSFKQLFESSPVALWEEDFTAIIRAFEKLREAGISNFKEYFDTHPEEVQRFSMLVLILDVNQAAIKLFEAESKNDLMTRLGDTFTENSLNNFKKELVRLATGAQSYRVQSEMVTLNGASKIVDLDVIVEQLPEHSSDKMFYRGIVAMQDITEQVARENELKASEIRFRETVDLLPVAVYEADTKLNLTFYNRKALELFGFPPGTDLIGQNTMNWVVPEERQAARDNLKKRLQTNMNAESAEYTGLRQDGSTFPLLIQVSVLNKAGTFAGFRGVIVDLTAQKELRKQLQESVNLLENLVQTAAVIIIALDTEGKVIRFNRFAEDITGYAADEVLQQNWFDIFIPPEDQHVLPTVFREVLQGMPARSEYENAILTKAGTQRLIHWNNTVSRDSAGNITGVISIGRDVTEQRQTEEKRAELQAFLQKVIDGIPEDLIVINRDYSIAWANQAIKDKVADRFPVCEGQSCHLVLHGLTEPCDGVDYPCPFSEVIQTRKIVSVDHTHHNLRGEPIPVEVIAVPIVSASGDVVQVIESSRDISERLAAARELELSEERYRTFFENNDAVILIIDPDSGLIQFANKSAIKFYGYPQDEIIGMHIGRINVLPADEIARRMARAREDDQNYFVFQHRLASGEIRDVEVYQSKLMIQDRELFSIIVMDISERLKMQAEKEALEKQVLHVQKLESLGLLAGGIAHDFNNLLTGILGNASLALADLSHVSPIRDNIMDIEKAARNAADLAKQMLAYSGKGRFVIESIHLGELVEEMTHMLEASISKRAKLKLLTDKELPAIKGDAIQIRQVLMNLITNASESLDGKDGMVTLLTGVMECDNAYLNKGVELFRNPQDEPLPEGTYVYFEVADTGCGMDKETIGKIFDPFFTTKFTGRGLGMAAVLGIVRGHNGAIKVYSEPGRGSTFKVLFPAVGKQPVARTRKTQESPVELAGEGTIMIVDDEDAVREVGKRILTRWGYSVLTAVNGQEALQLYKQHGQEIICVLLDLTMPQMDGEETFRELRRLNTDIRVILCSGYNEQEATQHFIGKGLAGFLKKPYSMQDLKQKLQEILGNGNSSEEPVVPDS